jgi:tetraacyldisaccharide 4'-kinase
MTSLERIWYDETLGARLARAALRPAELGYAWAVAIRGALYDRRLLAIGRAPVPVLAIGNVSVGGTGKTPLTAWAAARLRESGARPAIVLRGYGGDEPLVHAALNPETSVIVDADRLRGARTAHAAGADCVVLDDAFQHRRIARTADWALVAAEQVERSRHLLPRGPLREPLGALARAGVAIVTRKRDALDHAAEIAHALGRSHGVPTAVVHLSPSGMVDAQRGHEDSLDALRGRRVLALAAVGDPASFFAQLAELGVAELRTLHFADHHAFTRAEVERIARSADGTDLVLCTLKDAVKLAPLWTRQTSPLWYVSQRVEVDRGADVLEASLASILAARTRGPSTAGVAG